MASRCLRAAAFLVWALSAGRAVAQGPRTLAECESSIRGRPRVVQGYECLLAHRMTEEREVLRFLDVRLRRDPGDPRPLLFRTVVHYLAGEPVDRRDFERCSRAFTREGDVAGQVLALSWHMSELCVRPSTCGEQAGALLWRAGELARASHDVSLLQHWAIRRLKWAILTEDLAAQARAESDLLALGPPVSEFLKLESLQLRAAHAGFQLDYPRMRALAREMLESLDPGDPRRTAALGTVASATVNLALQGVESTETAERSIRTALAEEERIGLELWYPQVGYLPSRILLALLLGPTPEAESLLRSALDGYRARVGWTNLVWAKLALAETLASSAPPRLDEALRFADDLVRDSPGDFTLVLGLVERSRIRFAMRQLSLASADGFAAIDLAEHSRELETDVEMRMRYAESTAYAYRSLAGALLEHRATDDVSELSDSLQVMERLRARGLMETLLEEDTSGPFGRRPGPVEPPTLGQIRAQLDPREALLSFEVWRPEPSMHAPFRDGTSWLTVVTTKGARAYRIPNGDVLKSQIRAWTGLLARRDGSDREPGARLHEELLQQPLEDLPAGVERLILVPDGPLHRLPFDALSAGVGTPYLAERFSTSVQPSAALWLRFRSGPGHAPGRLLALADPVQTTTLGDARGVGDALSNARREASVALSVFPAGSELRTGAPASESFLKAAPLEGVSLLHLATHAVSDEADPEHSAVMLAPGSPAEDGRLEPREIARLRLDGKAVVLAGCETSAGAVFRGEGVMSLARAFFTAGASAVVGTLDRARDDEAGALFTVMYRALGHGVTLGEALSAAKRERIREGAPAAAWAGVVLLGDASVRPREPEASVPGSLALAGVALTCAGVGAGQWWRRRRHG